MLIGVLIDVLNSFKTELTTILIKTNLKILVRLELMVQK